MKKTGFRLMLGGDAMLGRLVDQIFPEHVQSEEDFQSVSRLFSYYPKECQTKIKTMQHKYVWGDLLPHMLEADMRVINLETSVTSNHRKWPNKVFNYRMHPANLQCLVEAKIDYCSLANNHTLDFGYDGMRDTMKSMTECKIAWSGVGVNSIAAMRPAILERSGLKFAFFSFADHPEMWQATLTRPGINFLNVEQFSEDDIARVKGEILRTREEQKIDFVMVSLHWGPNYAWTPSKKSQQFAHMLIDQAGVDIIHGHSSHHIQGIEIYKQKPIFYGCGDLVDDYAVDGEYRNDLGFLYTLDICPEKRIVQHISLLPTKIQFFSANECHAKKDRYWLENTMTTQCQHFGTVVKQTPSGLQIDLETTQA